MFIWRIFCGTSRVLWCNNLRKSGKKMFVSIFLQTSMKNFLNLEPLKMFLHMLVRYEMPHFDGTTVFRYMIFPLLQNVRMKLLANTEYFSKNRQDTSKIWSTRYSKYQSTGISNGSNYLPSQTSNHWQQSFQMHLLHYSKHQVFKFPGWFNETIHVTAASLLTFVLFFFALPQFKRKYLRWEKLGKTHQQKNK